MGGRWALPDWRRDQPGGMGVVYRARDTKLNREVALKVLPTDVVADPDRRNRFIIEAQTASQLQHPHIGVVYEVDEIDGVSFIAMELIRGEKLSDVLHRAACSTSRALPIAIEIAEGSGVRPRGGSCPSRREACKRDDHGGGAREDHRFRPGEACGCAGRRR